MICPAFSRFQRTETVFFTACETNRFHSSSPPLSERTHDALVLFDSLSESHKAVPENREKGLAWYTCGPTTYAPSHLGHARTYVCLDIIRRILEDHCSSLGLPAPLFVTNITDVDDKILSASKDAGESPVALARRFERDFWRDMDALGCKRPHVVTRVTEHVESDIIPFIQKLVDNQFAYLGDDGVYFDLHYFEEKAGHLTRYGKLAPHTNAEDVSLNGTPSEEGTNKRDPRDFALWKTRKADEEMYWESPWGEGRPGWHIECSAMIEAVSNLFQDTHTFHFHAGGIDLQFPHHTNEIAQSEAYRFGELEEDKEWIPHWIHTGHLHIQGLKMSKSLKNFVTIEEMLQAGGDGLGSPADDFRLWCLGLAGSYRATATYSQDRLNEAKVTREKIVRCLMDATDWIQRASDGAPKRWTVDERDLFNKVQVSSARAKAALRGNLGVDGDSGTRRVADFDGATFLQEILQSVELVGSYVSGAEAGSRCPDALADAVARIRDNLALVGFSRQTSSPAVDEQSMGSNVVGGERAIADELAKFRALVREEALSSVKDGSSNDALKQILKMCDEMRDRTLPSLGLELLDGKEDNHQQQWRFCIPKEPSNNDSLVSRKATPAIELSSVNLEEYFKVGQYEGKFSTYSDDGIPTHNADGTEVSKSLLKKLMKKREKHKKRLKSKSDG